MEDKFLVEQTLNGNKNAFKLLVVRYQRPIFSFVKKFNVPDQRIEELAQETFLKAYKNLQSFHGEKGTFAGWLFTISKNLVLNEKKKKEESYEDSNAVENHISEDNLDQSPAIVMERKQNVLRVNKLINMLPDPFKSAVILSYMEELSLQEIATMEQCEVGTIKSRIHRGKNLLIKMLFTEGQYEY